MITKEEFLKIINDDEEFGEFYRIPNESRLATRSDVHAMVLLDRLLPYKDEDHRPDEERAGTQLLDYVAGDDEIHFEISLEDFLLAASPDDVLQLVRCSVSYDEDEGTLFLFTGPPA